MASSERVLVQATVRPVVYEYERREVGEKFHMHVDDVERHEDAVELAEADAVEEPSSLAPWPHKGVTPAQYLDRWPRGPQAVLAQQHVDAAAAADEGEPAE
jgi:hypothetical protein